MKQIERHIFIKIKFNQKSISLLLKVMIIIELVIKNENNFNIKEIYKNFKGMKELVLKDLFEQLKKNK